MNVGNVQTSSTASNSFLPALLIRPEAVGIVDVKPYLRPLTTNSAFILLRSSAVKNPPIADNVYWKRATSESRNAVVNPVNYNPASVLK